MRFSFSHRLSQFVALRVVIALTAFLATVDAATAADALWTNQKGESIHAEVIGYDIDRKEIIFARNEDGEVIHYPLRDLAWPSRLRAVFSPASLASLRESGWRLAPGFFIRVGLIWVVSLLVFVLVCGFGGFWTAARLVSGKPGLFHHLSGYLKYLFSNSLIALGAYTLLIGAALLSVSAQQSAAAPEPLNLRAILPSQAMLIALQVITWILLVFVIDFHYRVGFGRALLILILNGLFSFLIAAVLVGTLSAGIVYVAKQPYFIDHAVNDWLLEPIGLL
ncbi:MAG: hypothetical protein KDN19_10515 [Verrucomicrobiae bacterium]|nr:hypothetical protein [Verrucomicrobiae bacterium]